MNQLYVYIYPPPLGPPSQLLPQYTVSIHTEKTIIQKDVYFNFYCSTIYNCQDMKSNLKHPKCPSTEKWIQKMWWIYTMEYYSAVKKKSKFLDEVI